MAQRLLRNPSGALPCTSACDAALDLLEHQELEIALTPCTTLIRRVYNGAFYLFFCRVVGQQQ